MNIVLLIIIIVLIICIIFAVVNIVKTLDEIDNKINYYKDYFDELRCSYSSQKEQINLLADRIKELTVVLNKVNMNSDEAKENAKCCKDNVLTINDKFNIVIEKVVDSEKDIVRFEQKLDAMDAKLTKPKKSTV